MKNKALVFVVCLLALASAGAQNANAKKARFTVPADLKKGETIHIIVEVTDAGMPQLTRYQRVVVTGI